MTKKVLKQSRDKRCLYGIFVIISGKDPLIKSLGAQVWVMSVIA